VTGHLPSPWLTPTVRVGVGPAQYAPLHDPAIDRATAAAPATAAATGARVRSPVRAHADRGTCRSAGAATVAC